MGNITIEYHVKVSFEMEVFIVQMEEIFTKHVGSFFGQAKVAASMVHVNVCTKTYINNER